ncbi:IclR family transcriptional regulator, partial [Streptomyces sp. SBT349]|uniref:IclR family transcriptional regulator n=1 Tax=Streptomyces sp. SBT349 TaxID=1580539 RepID=UPI00069F547E
MKNRPAYGIDSVDHALRLALLLQQEGPLRVTDAAERLGVARSTAHRLLSMLVYRDFAEQDADRRYVAGPALRRPAAAEPVAWLRSVALPHLRALVARVNETVSLQFPLGDQVRFVVTVECDQVLRIGDREGRMLPTHLASGGLAMLALRPEEEVLAQYAAPDGPEVDPARLLRTLRQVRRQGYARNDEATETGVTAIGRAVRGGDGEALAALALAVPTARFRGSRPCWRPCAPAGRGGRSAARPPAPPYARPTPPRAWAG